MKFDDIFNKASEIVLLNIKNTNTKKENEAPKILPTFDIFKAKGIKNNINKEKTRIISIILIVGLLI